jgi:hypothetical protein
MTVQLNPVSPIAEDIRQRYLTVDTATVSDVLDAMGHFVRRVSCEQVKNG